MTTATRTRSTTDRTLRAGLAVLLLAAVGACGGKKDSGGGGAECKPLTVTIGGEPLSGLGHGLGYVEGGNYSLFVFDHDKVTCEHMLAKSRTTPPEEQALSAGLTTVGNAIGYNSNGKIGPGVEVSLAKKPAKPGDAMEMCVKATLPLKNGPHAGKELVAEGRLEGSFCGERK